MAYRAKTYTLREESTESGTRYFISFKDGQGEHHELEVLEQLFVEFRQMERRNRKLQQWNQRHREFNEVWDETLYRQAIRVPKTLDERMIEKERNEIFAKAVAQLPEIQRRHYILSLLFVGVNLFKEVTPMCNKTKDTARKEESHAEASDGLIVQLEDYLKEYPDSRLIVIDTLQKVRTAPKDNAYASGYGDISLIKDFADRHSLAVIVVHHIRKQNDSDESVSFPSSWNAALKPKLSLSIPAFHSFGICTLPLSLRK